jgi:hypothetical protein
LPSRHPSLRAADRIGAHPLEVAVLEFDDGQPIALFEAHSPTVVSKAGS